MPPPSSMHLPAGRSRPQIWELAEDAQPVSLVNGDAAEFSTIPCDPDPR
ncbi:hypothetical protein [Allorhodopirellula heiligendammensis]|nr:hypothetical protein [Allorhodopirellula heiligendammensis]